ncbi:hypothetical protein L1887_11459 [Cichorium endivia]|nr:hypothetical protein L1887_11459 [Cichorium endivia]
MACFPLGPVEVDFGSGLPQQVFLVAIIFCVNRAEIYQVYLEGQRQENWWLSNIFRRFRVYIRSNCGFSCYSVAVSVFEWSDSVNGI